MDYIKIGIYSELKLLGQGLESLINKTDGLNVEFTENSMDKLFNRDELRTLNILIFNPSTLNISFIETLKKLVERFAKLKILIISPDENEENILKTIKAGAKGLLNGFSDTSDLLEAIYTLRAGSDYYSNSITQLLLKKYINDIKSADNIKEQREIDCLSSREVEILKLWGKSYTNSEISETLYISVRTVESHKNHIMNKLNMKTAVDLVKFGIKNSIIDI